jgi:hypothetical protein
LVITVGCVLFLGGLGLAISGLAGGDADRIRDPSYLRPTESLSGQPDTFHSPKPHPVRQILIGLAVMVVAVVFLILAL